MPVPEEVRKREELKRVLHANALQYKIARIEDKDIFLQEAVWTLHSKKPIPTGKLVSHKDGNPLNNEFKNLKLVDENKEYGGDFHKDKNKIFHEENYQNNKDFIQKHFPDIYRVLFENNDKNE